MILLISCDLRKPERDTGEVVAKVNSFGAAIRLAESVWLVDTTHEPKQCRDRLREVTREATFFVARLSHGAAGYKLAKAIGTWLKSSTRHW
jgi:hypothetical protein